MIIGITGKYCSGKTKITNFLKSNYNFSIISVDKIGHLALEALSNQVVETFGIEVLSDNKIDRKKLGQIVFNNSTKLKQLEQIVHPWMNKQIINTIKSSPKTNWIIDSALLYTMELNTFCNKIFIIHSNVFIRIYRAFKRDKLNLAQIISRLKSQKNIPDKNYYKKIIKVKKKSLNTTNQDTEILVKGTYTNSVLQKIMLKIFDGDDNGSIFLQGTK